MNTQLEERFGWFSSKQAEVSGTFIYEDMDGNEVEVTEVTEWTRCEPNPGPIWDDYVCLGPVGRYVKDGRRGAFYDMEKRLEKYVRLDEIEAKRRS